MSTERIREIPSASGIWARVSSVETFCHLKDCHLDCSKRNKGMNELIQRIHRRIDEKKFCTIFEKDIAAYWPVTAAEREQRKAAIEAFAKQNGWSATILDPGIRVTFRRDSGRPS